MGMGKGIFNQLMFWVGPIDQFGQIDQGAVQKLYHLTEGEGGWSSADVRKVWKGGREPDPCLRKKSSLLISKFLILKITKNGITCSKMGCKLSSDVNSHAREWGGEPKHENGRDRGWVQQRLK